MTLADIQVGDTIRVEGAVKDGVFTATSVNVGRHDGRRNAYRPAQRAAAIAAFQVLTSKEKGSGTRGTLFSSLCRAVPGYFILFDRFQAPGSIDQRKGGHALRA